MRPLKIGTRGSHLARTQTDMVAAALSAVDPRVTLEIVTIATRGDRVLDTPLHGLSSPGLFVREIEEALVDGRIDVAVHSMKDLPTELRDGCEFFAVLERGDPRDAFVARLDAPVSGMSGTEVVGTSSLRRRAQLLHTFPGVRVVDIRGNVETRIAKVDRGICDATLLATCGLQRAGLADRVTYRFDPQEMLPAACQGIIAVEGRRSDWETRRLVESISHAPTMREALAERAFLRCIQGGCRAPIGCLSRIGGTRISLTGLVADVSGQQILRESVVGDLEDAERLGEDLARRILARGGKEILESSHIVTQ